jgi:putative FmdB family regulatory protein
MLRPQALSCGLEPALLRPHLSPQRIQQKFKQNLSELWNMPFYEYVCTECGQQTEVLQRLSDPPETECPNCHQPALIKQVSAAGFRLKGSGWYETDFKSGNKRNLEGESSAPSAVVKDGAAKAESKPDAKAAEPAPAKAESKAESKSAKAEPASSTSSSGPKTPA